MQTLLEKILGQFEISLQDFCCIRSKYCSIAEFLEVNFPKNCLSDFHINIASLQKHINELRDLINGIKHNFHIIAISETRITDEKSYTTNIDIENYKFVHTPTSSAAGGVGLYIRAETMK